MVKWWKKRTSRISRGGLLMAPSVKPQIMIHDGIVPSAVLAMKGASPFTTRIKTFCLFFAWRSYCFLVFFRSSTSNRSWARGTLDTDATQRYDPRRGQRCKRWRGAGNSNLVFGSLAIKNLIEMCENLMLAADVRHFVRYAWQLSPRIGRGFGHDLFVESNQVIKNVFFSSMNWFEFVEACFFMRREILE